LSSEITALVPDNSSFFGLPWYAQAIVLGDLPADGHVDLDPQSSSASGGLVGSF
jgi:hypothetical protein